ncbi:2-hydroxyacid dehydrogenase [Brevibacterium samyangense]|uniref:2-hydroxyacid dehydrogenase n=1 Tax=Brevibacterium samyangense TaxID=366888 RepID=A0ABP5F241_9MICO
MTTLDITTIAFPDAELREKVLALVPDLLEEQFEFPVWSHRHQDDSVSREDIDMVILPYLGGQKTVPMLEDLPNLRAVQTQSTGYDIVAHKVGQIAVANASGVHAAATAELAIGLALASLRGIDGASRDMVAHTWNHTRLPGLADRKVLLIGVGGIGREITKRILPFEVELTRVGTRAREDDHGTVHGIDELPQLLPGAEVVILITPLTPQTEKLVDAEFLAALPDGALLVNVARGKVVDTDALVAELESGRLRAALDVVDPEPLPADHPLWSAPNTLITPHVGGNTEAFEPRIVKLLAEQIRRIQAGEELLNLVTE